MAEKKPARTRKKQASPARDERGRILPGHTGNPNGRPPKGYSITETLKAMMDEKPEIKQALGTKLVEMALKGDLAAIKLLMSYIDGNPVQRNELTGKDGEALTTQAVIYLPSNDRDPEPTTAEEADAAAD